MGACDFAQTARGKNAAEAFASAVEQAQYDHGHAGYSGTIAEKSSFHSFGKVASVDEARAKARTLDDKVNDKWGPAGCIEIEPAPKAYADDTMRLFYFFGWASS